MMIRAVIFDCFGVLTTDTWRAFLDSLPQDIDREPAHEANRAYDAGLLTTQEFLGKIQASTGRKPRQVEELSSNEIVKNTQLLSYISELKQTYKIGIISNIATPWIQDAFLSPDELELFDTLVLSYEAGMTKPDPRIYRLACQRLEIEPEEAVFIDDIDRFCRAAEAEGMRAIVYSDFAQLKQDLDAALSRG